MFVPRYTEEQTRKAIAASFSYAEALRAIGLRPSGGNHRLFRRYVDEIWKISTDHFDPRRAQLTSSSRRPIPLERILVDGSDYNRGTLKRPLFASGLKQRRCELCGQDENWRGARMALILDHINGVPNDNRLENLRIVCPNCAATFETHCGRKNAALPGKRACAVCGEPFVPRTPRQRHCSQACGTRHRNRRREPHPEWRKVERPPYDQLRRDLEETSYLAVARKYGVSDNAVRKWIRWDAAAEERREPPSPDDPSGAA